MKEHSCAKKFKCDICDRHFYVEWRLKRHIKGHNDVNQKICYFFNSGKHCPYDEGKFAHTVFENSEKGDAKVDIETTDKTINDELKEALEKVKGFEVNQKEMEDRIKLYSATIKKLRGSQEKC